jgi:hypothetical protein
VRVEGAAKDVVFRVSSLIEKMLVLIEISTADIDWDCLFGILTIIV